MDADVHERYFTATGQEGGNPLIFRGVSTVPNDIDKGDFPNLVTLLWRYEPAGHGMPDADDNKRQIDLEDDLISLEGDIFGWQMLVVTGNGRKEWFWYVRDYGDWTEAVRKKLQGKTYPMEISVEEDPNWLRYETFMSSMNDRGATVVQDTVTGTNATANEDVRAELRKHGDDGRASRMVKHYAYFPSEKDEKRYRRFLVEREYRIDREHTAAPPPTSWAILFSKAQAPADIDDETEALDREAELLGGVYDGWETVVVK